MSVYGRAFSHGSMDLFLHNNISALLPCTALAIYENEFGVSLHSCLTVFCICSLQDWLEKLTPLKL